MAELRYHPLIKDWVMIASHRQNRPQMPKDYCPFCPGSGKVPDQFDVLEYRLKSEYGVDIVRTALPYRLARWVKSEVEEFDAKTMTLTSTSMLVLDRDEEPVVIFESEWAVDWAIEHNEKLKLSFEYIHGGS